LEELSVPFEESFMEQQRLPRCLWVGRYIPYPADAGAKVYSAKLAEALARSGASVRFMGFGTSDAVPTEARDVQWVCVPNGKRSEIAALFSRLPNAAAIDATQSYRDMLDAQLAERWDAIVLDGYAAGWALDRCLAYSYTTTPRPVLVHVSHNHEAVLWREMASQAQASLPKKLALRHNALKVRTLERRLVRNVDLLSAITDEDRNAMLTGMGAQIAPRALTLTPGYAGSRSPPRRIDARTPMRVAIVGSFRWIVKQENLRRFIEVADPAFAKHGIGLDVIGDVPETLRSQLSSHVRATQFRGFVDDPTEALSQARMAVVPEVFGGGFKLKFLDYIFARVPVATLNDAAAGLPSALREQMLSRDDLESLVQAIVAEIDSFDLLNARQQQAFDIAETLYRWSDRGRELRQAIVQIQRDEHAQRHTSNDALNRLSASPVK
jgi:glycosyltransferase involved in cell wall biosynthesis